MKVFLVALLCVIAAVAAAPVCNSYEGDCEDSKEKTELSGATDLGKGNI